MNDKFTFKFGVSGIYYDFDPGSISPSDANSSIRQRNLDNKFALESGAYVSLEHKITPKFTAKYGLRYSYFSRFGSQALNNYANDLPVVYNQDLGIYESANPIGQTTYSNREEIASYNNLEPRLALSYKVTEESSVKASYNRMSQYLHLISNTVSATPLDVWAPSGKFLKPQLADQFALGYFRNIKNGDYSIEVEGYYKTIANRVDYINGADLIANNSIETEILIGETRAQGIEVLLKKNEGDLTGWVSYTLSSTEQRTPGGKAGGKGINNGDWYRAPYDRTHDISVTGVYKLSPKWKFGANFVFQTGRPVTYPNGQFQYNGLSIATYSNRNADRLSAYHRLDISATLTPSRKSKRWKGEWVFSIYNVYHRKNAASISFSQNIETAKNEAEKTYIFGFMPSVTYSLNFKK